MSDADKQARLAEALRANLRKRKAQAREVSTPSPADRPHPNLSPEGEGL